MNDYLKDYLKTRRSGWPYDGRYVVRPVGCDGFVAMIDGAVAGLAWADVADAGAVMHMKLNSDYKEYGIGTELLHILMQHLIDAGCSVIRYTISIEHWAYQIYDNLGFKIESRDEEKIHFVRYIDK